MLVREINVGDEVYVYRSDLIKSFLEGNLIKGIIVNKEYYDYGYHGSGDWVCDYIVKGEDEKEYYANHGYGYKKYKIVTKEEVIECVNSFIAKREEYKTKTHQELSSEAIGDYIIKYINSKKKECRELNKEISTLNEALEEFKTGDVKGIQYKKGKR